MKRALYLIPFCIIAGLSLFLWQGLTLQPHIIDSPLVGKPMPKFSGSDLFNTNHLITQQDFNGQVALVNIWATWCGSCQMEHPFLIKLSKQQILPIYGIDYKDQPQKAQAWLNKNENPFAKIISDEDGHVGIAWGAYGTPETYLIDKKGIVRYKHTGLINQQVWQNEFLPLVSGLQAEGS